MAGPILIPMTLSAKAVKAPLKVPSLNGQPFDTKSDVELAPGVHLHWALPDNFTRGKIKSDLAPDKVFFPGIPDLWLVVRFNQMVQKFGGTRVWEAWVLDSRSGTFTTVDKWSPPNSPSSDTIHTAPGVLPSAAKLGMPGWGWLDATGGAFDPLTVAYYPSCRHRLGFHDATATGLVTYTVVGWISTAENDPLHLAHDSSSLLNDWKIAYQPKPRSYDEVGTAVSATATGAWATNAIATVAGNFSSAKMQAAVTSAAEIGSLTAANEKLQTLQQSFPPASAANQVTATAFTVTLQQDGINSIRCHGSLYNVDVSGPASPTVVEKVTVYPSIKRALATIASSASTDADIDAVEMLLQDVDNQKGTSGGIIDYPGAVHALSFQSAAGAGHSHARIEILPHEILTLALQQAFYKSGINNWPPPLGAPSVSSLNLPSIADVKPELLHWYPNSSPNELAALKGKVTASFAALTKAVPLDKGLNDHLVYVVDYRAKAQTPALGPMTGGHGADGAGYWLDIKDEDAVNRFLAVAAGSVVHLPDPDNLYAVPGERWRRPWSPQVAIHSAQRSYLYGFDGRFTADGYVLGRMGGETMVGLGVGSWPIAYAADLIDKPEALFSTVGLPPEIRGLVNEALLLDAQSAGAMAGATAKRGASEADMAAAAQAYKNAIFGLYLGRKTDLTSDEQLALDKILTLGLPSSPLANTIWKDPTDPLFVDVDYSHPHTSLDAQWVLPDGEVEMRPRQSDAGATIPPKGQVLRFKERSPVTATIARVLESAMVGRETLDASGQPRRAMTPPAGIQEGTFGDLDIVSAPLTKFDPVLYGDGRRERTGALRVNKLHLVDIFGVRHGWDGNIEPSSPAGDEDWPNWTPLTPRLPYWARLHFRFQAANHPIDEATLVDSPICAVLVPDFLEHAVEVFDGAGKAIGQLSADTPGFGVDFADQGGATLRVNFDLHPWVAQELGLGPDDALDALENPALRDFVESLLAQSTEVPAAVDQDKWYETGLTAAMRIIDTVRSTLDPSVQTRDRKMRIMGEPILLLAAKLHLEGTSTEAAWQLANPAPLDTSKPLPAVTVRIGDVTRPDDGVLGCYIPGDSGGTGSFAPVSQDAATHAVLNKLLYRVAGALGEPVPADHPFVGNKVSEFKLQPGGAVDLLIFADTRGNLYASSGVLPRKRLPLPMELIEPVLAKIEPTFAIGPVIASHYKNGITALLPPPQVEGYETELVWGEALPGSTEEEFLEAPVPPTPPFGELPDGRASLIEGWLRLVPHESEAQPTP